MRRPSARRRIRQQSADATRRSDQGSPPSQLRKYSPARAVPSIGQGSVHDKYTDSIVEGDYADRRVIDKSVGLTS